MMLFAETRWPDVAMAFVQMLVYIGGLAGVAWAGWLKLKSMALELKAGVKAAEAAEAKAGVAAHEAKTSSESLDKKLDVMGGKIDDNTALTVETKDATNGRINDLLDVARAEGFAKGKAEVLQEQTGKIIALEAEIAAIPENIKEQMRQHREKSDENAKGLAKQLEDVKKELEHNGPRHE